MASLAGTYSALRRQKRLCANQKTHRRVRPALARIIDTHTHSDLMALAEPLNEPKIMQGVTTEMLEEGRVSFRAVPSEVAKAESFETFYQREYRPVVGLVVALGGDTSSAEDVAQEAFLAAKRRWSITWTKPSVRSSMRSNVRRRSTTH